MAVALGKRKRAVPTRIPEEKSAEEVEDDDQQAMKDLFRKHFESKYKPLDRSIEQERTDHQDGSTSESEAEEVEWSGFSEDEDFTAALVQHVDIAPAQQGFMDKRELKAFLSSKIPIQKASPSTTTADKSRAHAGKLTDGKDEEESATNLKNDLALQRLLSESHLLSKDKSRSDLQVAGKSRHKALDLRFQALGSKDSLFAQQKMPMQMRKGVVRKQTEREQKRRREAKDAGIVLEREVRNSNNSNSKKKLEKRRDRGVDAPAVGSFKGGMLRLNRHDLNDIQRTKSHGPRRR